MLYIYIYIYIYLKVIINKYVSLVGYKHYHDYIGSCCNSAWLRRVFVVDPDAEWQVSVTQCKRPMIKVALQRKGNSF